MLIRAAREADALAMGHVMVATYLAAHRDQIPAKAWTKGAQEWTPEASGAAWARTLRQIAAGQRHGKCIFVAEDQGGDLVGLAMGGPMDVDDQQQVGAVYALYVRHSHQGRGLGRRLVRAVAADLAAHGRTALRIGCLAANAPARRCYEALGGRVVGERLFDEEGMLLPEVVYAWPDIQTLAPEGQPHPAERRSA